jgi:hypothetical protein
VLQRTDLAPLTRLKHLEALEIAYAKMVEGTADNKWQSLLEISLEAKNIEPSEINWSVLEVRREFAKRSKDSNIVSAPVFSTLARAKTTEFPRLGTRCGCRLEVAFS